MHRLAQGCNGLYRWRDQAPCVGTYFGRCLQRPRSSTPRQPRIHAIVKQYATIAQAVQGHTLGHATAWSTQRRIQLITVLS